MGATTTPTETDRRVAHALRPTFEAWGETAIVSALAHLIDQDDDEADRPRNTQIAALLRRTADRFDDLT